MSALQKLLRFGVFELNLDTEELRKSDTVVKLPPQPFKLLVLLASHAGQVVSRDKIQEQLWGEETYVDFEHGVNKCIKQIRAVLNDKADRPVYIETVPRHGYRFLAPVVSKTILAPPSKVVESKSEIPIVPVPGVGVVPPSAPPTSVASPGVGGAVALAKATTTAAPPEAELDARSHVVLFRVALVTVVLVALVASIAYWRARKVSSLTAKDTIVLADFKNSTGEKVFDDILKPALEFQLEQSPFLNVLSDQKVNDTLRLMNHPANEPLTPELAREVCLRTNSKALLGGMIAALGEQYQIELQATNCETGDTLGSSEAEAEGRSNVLKAVRAVGNDMRQKLGESLASVKEYDQPLEGATTSSLDALQAFTQARRAQIAGGDPIAGFKRALELDPKFAAAYAALGTAYDNQGQSMLAIQNYKRAYELRGRVSQRERFYIEANYAYVNGELEKANQIYLEWIQIYREDYEPHINLSVDYRLLGQYEKSVEEAIKAIQLRPEHVFGYVNLAFAYNALNRLDKAKATYDEAQARKLDFAYLRLVRYFTAFLERDDAVMQQAVEWAMGKQEAEDLLLATHSDTEAYYGKFQKARELSERAVQSAKQADSPENEASWKVNAALREAEIGGSAQARQLAAEALALNAGKDIATRVALVLARTGDAVQAQALVDKLDGEFPLDTILQRYSLPSIRAAIELRRHDPQKAVEDLQVAMPYELGTPSSSFGNLYPAYLRGEAYVMAGQGPQAAAEFQKLIDHPGVVLNSITGALAHLQKARAQVMSGDKKAGRKSYQRFLEMWQNADPELPLLQAAQAEYKRIN